MLLDQGTELNSIQQNTLFVVNIIFTLGQINRVYLSWINSIARLARCVKVFGVLLDPIQVDLTLVEVRHYDNLLRS